MKKECVGKADGHLREEAKEGKGKPKKISQRIKINNWGEGLRHPFLPPSGSQYPIKNVIANSWLEIWIHL